MRSEAYVTLPYIALLNTAIYSFQSDVMSKQLWKFYRRDIYLIMGVTGTSKAKTFPNSGVRTERCQKS